MTGPSRVLRAPLDVGKPVKWYHMRPWPVPPGAGLAWDAAGPHRQPWVAPSAEVERLSSGRLAAGVERDLLHARFRLLEQLFAARLERLAALVHGDGLLERHLAALELAHDRLELRDRRLEGHRLHVGIRLFGHLSHPAIERKGQFMSARAARIGRVSGDTPR